MEDPLLALRNAIRSKFAIKILKDDVEEASLKDATHLQLSSSLSLPKSAPTRLKKASASSASGSKPEDCIQLGPVYLAWKLKDVSAAEYTKLLRENGVVVDGVMLTDRKGVVEWLEGKRKDLAGAAPLTSDSKTPPGSPTRTTATPSASPSKRKYVADLQDLEVVKKIRANEIELQDRNTVLRGTKPNNFSNLQKQYAEKLKKMKEASKAASSSSQTATSSTAISKPLTTPQKSSKHNYPIIMISSSPTSLITMYNVKRFLEDSTFEPSGEAKARAMLEGNGKPEDVIPVYRQRTFIGSGGKEVESKVRYFVVDGVEALSKFGADAWDRVVCVMTTGQAWQFRPYKWNDPRQLFHHVKGVYVSWSNDPPNLKIQDWNVMELKIDPHRRHVDKSVVAHYWKVLDTWTNTNKPWLIG